MRETIRDKTRLEHIIEAIDNLITWTDGKTLDDFPEKSSAYFGLIKAVEIVGEASYMLSTEFRANYGNVAPWEIMTRLRHVLVHGYYHVVPSSLWQTIVEDIIPLRSPIAACLATLQ